MTYKVGIPRALFYYKFYPFWTTFFNELGVETVVSEKTTKKILDDGVKSCVDEACLAIKVFYGHVLNLKDRVDYLGSQDSQVYQKENLYARNLADCLT